MTHTVSVVRLNGRQQIFWQFFDLSDSRRPPEELKVASRLGVKNPHRTIYEMISLLSSFFYENINAHF